MHTIPAALSLFLSLLLFHPSWLRPLLPLVFLSRSLYLPPMAESGRATGSKTRRLQNVGQPSVLSYRLETAVCVCGPLDLRVAMQAGVSEPCTQAAQFPHSGASLAFFPQQTGWIMGLHAYPGSVKRIQTNQALIIAQCNDVYARRQINVFYFGSHNGTPGGSLPSFFSGLPYLWSCLLFSWKLLSCRMCFPSALDNSWCVMWIIQKIPRVSELWWSWRLACLKSTLTPLPPGVGLYTCICT